jgi:hypothetical protein
VLREAREPDKIHIKITTKAAAPPVCMTAEARGQSNKTFDKPVINCTTKHASNPLDKVFMARTLRKAKASQAKYAKTT